MNTTTNVGIGIEIIHQGTPELPDAKRGDTSDKTVRETRAQLDAGLIWWPCSFCGLRVLIDSNVRGRERCKCGAVRCHSRGSEGWRRGGKTWWFI